MRATALLHSCLQHPGEQFIEGLPPRLAGATCCSRCRFETTGHTIGWTLYEIAAHPEVQQRVAAELAAAGLLGPGARRLEYADLANLTYLNWALKESMRLHPVAATGSIRCTCPGAVAFSTPCRWHLGACVTRLAHPLLALPPAHGAVCRKADRPLTLGGYRLSPGTLLWAPFICLHTSRHNWERPLDFWPERWALEGQQVALPEAMAAAVADPAAVKSPAPTAVGHAANPGKTFIPFSDGEGSHERPGLGTVAAAILLTPVLSTKSWFGRPAQLHRAEPGDDGDAGCARGHLRAL